MRRAIPAFITVCLLSINLSTNAAPNGHATIVQGPNLEEIKGGAKIWAQADASDFHMDKVSAFAEGYDGARYGAAVGVDWPHFDAWHFGVALGAGKTYLDSKQPFHSKNVIRSAQGSAYATMFQDNFYFKALVGVGRHNFSSDRHVSSMGTYVHGARTDFNATEYLSKLKLAYHWTHNFYIVKPFADLIYSYIDPKNNGLGAGGLNLIYDTKASKAFVGGLGLKLAVSNHYPRSVVTPYVKAKLSHDFEGDRAHPRVGYVPGGTVFGTQGYKANPTAWDLGVGVLIVGEKNTVFTIDYDYYCKSHFDAHTGYLKFRYAW